MRHLTTALLTVAVVSASACGTKKTPPPAAEAKAAPAESTPAATPAPEPPVIKEAPDTAGCHYAISNQTVAGPCPAGPADQGQCELTQNGDRFTYVFKSGRTCRPASMCTFEGTVAGGKFTGQNEATVDNEGGKVVNTVEFVLGADGKASGAGTSQYSHPGGMRCEWRYQITFSP